MRWWRDFHAWRWWVRSPVQASVLAGVVVLVLYPRPELLARHWLRIRDVNSVIDPTVPALAELEQRVLARVGTDAHPAELLGAVERTVHECIPYAWDWEVWGVLDYLPTTAEVLAAGREDCDGRAVLAASLLRRLGQPAWLVCDVQHTWVATPVGELMGPGKGPQSITGTERGTRVQWNWGLLKNAARGLAFGIQVFPLRREALLVAALCGVTLHPYARRWRQIAGCLLLAAALVILRHAGDAERGVDSDPLWSGLGLAAGAAGWLLLAVRMRVGVPGVVRCGPRGQTDATAVDGAG